MSYKLQVFNQENEKSNTWFLNKPEMLIWLNHLLDNQKSNEIIIIEKSELK